MLGGEGVKLVKGIKSYKPPVIKRTSHRDVIYSIRDMVNNIVIPLLLQRGRLCLQTKSITRLFMVTTLCCMQILNYCVVHK